MSLQKNKISEQHKKIRQRKNMTKELAKKATDSMKKPKHLRTDNMETVNYNSDVERDD